MGLVAAVGAEGAAAAAGAKKSADRTAHRAATIQRVERGRRARAPGRWTNSRDGGMVRSPSLACTMLALFSRMLFTAVSDVVICHLPPGKSAQL